MLSEIINILEFDEEELGFGVGITDRFNLLLISYLHCIT